MRRRLLASNLAFTAIVLLLLELPLGLVYSSHEHDSFDAGLQRDAVSLAALSEEITENSDADNAGNLVRRYSSGGAGEVIIVDGNGTQLTPDSPTSDDQALQAALLAARAGRAGMGEHDQLTYATATIPSGDNRPGAVALARSDEAIDERAHRFWLLLGLIAGGLLAVSTLVSHLLARWAIGPLRALDAVAAQLGSGVLSARAQVERGPSEVVALALTLNEMAERLEALIQAQSRFVADASHQLRTPLTALRLRLDNLDAADPTNVAATREAALSEAARLSRLVDGLLTLARSEGQRPARRPVDVTAIVGERHAAWAPLAAEQGVDLHCEGPAGPLLALVVPGHLDQMVDNLIDNALDATPSGRAIVLRVANAATASRSTSVTKGAA
jgi:signal transduction histidine kinase